MNINSTLVFLLKASSEGADTSYDKGISELGLDPVSLPPITFEWVNLPTLLSKLLEPQLFSGMVLTSQRSVQAVVECIQYGHQDTTQMLEAWKQKKIFVVGPATCAAAETLLGMTGSGKDSGNSEALALVILDYFNAHPEKHQSVLFPCSSLKQETLPCKLRENGVSIECIECYKTKPHADLPQLFNLLIESKGVPAYFVFFSPSGVRSVIPILQQKQIPVDDLKLVSMGPSTSKCLTSFGLICAAEAPSPDTEGLVQVLRNLQSHKSPGQ